MQLLLCSFSYLVIKRSFQETHTVPWHLVKISCFVTSIIIFSGTTCKLDKILNKNWKLLKYNSTRRMENRMYALMYQFFIKKKKTWQQRGGREMNSYLPVHALLHVHVLSMI